MKNSRCFICKAVLLTLCASISAVAQQLVLQVDPAQSTIRFTLEAPLHSVHGTFQTKTSELRFNPASGEISGNITADAKSGETGNGMRDRKMHNEVLESQRYPEIVFRPGRVEGNVQKQAKSVVKVHGTFTIHGLEREITVPAEVELDSEHWRADTHFSIPYAKWGMKNPSTFFLHVSDEVQIELNLKGPLKNQAGTSSAQ